MTPTELASLEALAKSATPGPWSYPRDKSNAPDTLIYSEQKPDKAQSEHGACIAQVSVYDAVTGLLPKRQYEANAAFIAAANPAAILSLIEEYKRMREALENALPYVETLHSLVSKRSTTRAQVWAVVKEIRAALEPQS